MIAGELHGTPAELNGKPSNIETFEYVRPLLFSGNREEVEWGKEKRMPDQQAGGSLLRGKNPHARTLPIKRYDRHPLRQDLQAGSM